jgi:hypothetical protein
VEREVLKEVNLSARELGKSRISKGPGFLSISSNTNALNQMLKRVHDKKTYAIPNHVLNLFQDFAISESRFWE